MRCISNALAVLALKHIVNAIPLSQDSRAKQKALHVTDKIFSYEDIEGDCSPLPPGSGPHINPDSPDAFITSRIWSVCYPKSYIVLGADLDRTSQRRLRLQKAMTLNLKTYKLLWTVCRNQGGLARYQHTVMIQKSALSFATMSTTAAPLISSSFAFPP